MYNNQNTTLHTSSLSSLFLQNTFWPEKVSSVTYWGYGQVFIIIIQKIIEVNLYSIDLPFHMHTHHSLLSDVQCPTLVLNTLLIWQQKPLWQGFFLGWSVSILGKIRSLPALHTYTCRGVYYSCINRTYLFRFNAYMYTTIMSEAY